MVFIRVYSCSFGTRIVRKIQCTRCRHPQDSLIHTIVCLCTDHHLLLGLLHLSLQYIHLAETLYASGQVQSHCQPPSSTISFKFVVCVSTCVSCERFDQISLSAVHANKQVCVCCFKPIDRRVGCHCLFGKRDRGRQREWEGLSESMHSAKVYQ